GEGFVAEEGVVFDPVGDGVVARVTQERDRAGAGNGVGRDDVLRPGRRDHRNDGRGDLGVGRVANDRVVPQNRGGRAFQIDDVARARSYVGDGRREQRHVRGDGHRAAGVENIEVL